MALRPVELKFEFPPVQTERLRRGDVVVLRVPQLYAGMLREIATAFSKLRLPRGVNRVVMMEGFELTVARNAAEKRKLEKRKREKEARR
jgi:hypothetical protein